MFFLLENMCSRSLLRRSESMPYDYCHWIELFSIFGWFARDTSDRSLGIKTSEWIIVPLFLIYFRFRSPDPSETFEEDSESTLETTNNTKY